MSMMDDLLLYEEVSEMNEHEFNLLTYNHEPMKACHYYVSHYQQLVVDVGFHPFKEVYIIEDETGIAANESDPEGGWCFVVAFKHKGKYYSYVDQG